MKTLIVIPCYNEEDNIEILIKKIQALKYDYLVINDKSTDNSEILLNGERINHLSLCNNVGLANVTQIGFKYAKDNEYEAMVVIDGDGQHPPQYIFKLLSELEKGNDLVIGSRYLTEKKPFTPRMIGSRLLASLILLKTGKKYSDPTSGMRAFGFRIIKEFADDMNYIAEPDALVAVTRKKYKVKEVQVYMESRQGGESYFSSPFKTFKYMFTSIISILLIR